ncbi:hypothetical protein ACH5RR_035108 [Cinchona calisaya]|uniref:NAC domain-containing protein n=1 Tax=Cinchona calisaya TaxID=153742 RepID=A0ABD2YFW7_9GENT
MCPPAPHPPADMALNGADEQVIMFLDRFRHGNPLPTNVIEDINPYQFNPSNLPGGLWYLVHNTEKKETNKYGFWREKEAACEIFTSSSIRGRRTTLEFIEFQDAREQTTNWVMQEYNITEKGLCGNDKQKESRVICRVFLSEGRSSSMGTHPNSSEAAIVWENHIPSVAPVVQSTDSTSKQGSRSVSLVNDETDRKKLLSELDNLLKPQRRDISELHDIFDGDYLEMNDLVDPQSRSTSSDNSSCSSLTLDDCFDAYALLQELKGDNNQGLQGKDTNSKFNVNASVGLCQVVMQPPTLGSLVCASGRHPPVGCKVPSPIPKTQNADERTPDHTVKRLEAEKRCEDPSSSLGVANSSSRVVSVSNGKEKAAGVKKNRLKNYFCFLPF